MALKINSTTVYENGAFRKIQAPQNKTNSQAKKASVSNSKASLDEVTTKEVKAPQKASNAPQTPKEAKAEEKEVKKPRIKTIIDGSQVKRTVRKRSTKKGEE